METKKNSKVNLENYRGMFFLVGLLFALMIVFVTINQTKADVNGESWDKTADANIDEELVMPINTYRPEPPPPPKTIIDQSVIEIVDDGVVITDLFDIPDPNEVNEFLPYDYFDGVIDPIETDVAPVVWTEQMPEPPGGEAALKVFVAKNIEYPQLAIDNDIQGTVYVRFVVNEKGKVQHPELVKGVDPLLDDEALRVIKLLPDFKPGMDSDGRAVSVWFSMPIVFQLR